MKICAGQISSNAGDIPANTTKHVALIEFAATHGANLIFFPELSLTGYEPRLAKNLAFSRCDARLNIFQVLSDRLDIAIGLGVPTTDSGAIRISMAWFTQNTPIRWYSKQQLHPDELAYFSPGTSQLTLNLFGHTLAPAICFESLQCDHAASASTLGADIYVASVAKSETGMKKAEMHYPEMARRHNMLVITANSIGPCDDFQGFGKSACWSQQGKLLTQLDSGSEGLVLVDSETSNAHSITYP